MAQALVEAYEKLKSQVQQVIVGQDDASTIAHRHAGPGTLFARRRPRLAKTLMVRLAQAINLSFRRIQFTPRPDARRHHRHRHHSGRQNHRSS